MTQSHTDEMAVVPAKSCFHCIFYVEGRCEVYDEIIESELFAASRCPDFTPEGNTHE